MMIDYVYVCELMVEQQICFWDVLDIKVFDVLVCLLCEVFVVDVYWVLVYVDVELLIGYGQKMMKLVIEGCILQVLDLQLGDEVLEIGMGSGFLLVCIGVLVCDVLSLEIDLELVVVVCVCLDVFGLGSNVCVEVVDVLFWQIECCFDVICVIGVVDVVLLQFVLWLCLGGCLFVIYGCLLVMEVLLVKVDGSFEFLFEIYIDYLCGVVLVFQFYF